MKCPACFNPLSQVTVGKVTVDVCEGGCGGIWFDAFELQRVDEPGETAGEWLIDVERDPGVQVDANRKRDCPRCEGIKLKRHFFSARRRVEVDHCPGCGGYWLDAGELDRIREETGEATQVAQIQAAGRSRISPEALRYIYRMRARLDPMP